MLDHHARNRLAKVLELLASPIVGEQLAAAATATKLVRASGRSWQQILNLGPVDSDNASRHAQRSWRATAAHCASHPALLTPWERDFLRKVLAQANPPSVKQQRVLREIAETVDDGDLS